MTKARQRIVTDGRQMSLLDLLIEERQERAEKAPGRLCCSAKLMMAVKRAIETSGKSRATLADEMTELSGQIVTVAMINNWTAESHPHRMPGELLPALCIATGCDEPLRVLAETAGLFTLPGKDALRAEVQKLREEENKIASQRKRREVFLKEMEG